MKTGFGRAWILVAVVLAGWTAVAQAHDFRIQSKVFLEGQTTPKSENLTIFHNGVVYDYGGIPPEITILDAHPQRRRFVLLDPQRKVKTEIKFEVIDDFIAKIKQSAAEAQSPLIQFLANPQFTEGFDKQTRVLSLGSDWLSYKLTTVTAPNADIARQYHEFSDAYAKLNTLTNAAALPPFARLHVNALLNKHQQVPYEVLLTLRGLGENEKDIVFRSEHKISWHLIDDDRMRIRGTDEHLVQFTPVDAKTYFKTAAPVTANRKGKQPGTAQE